LMEGECLMQHSSAYSRGMPAILPTVGIRWHGGYVRQVSQEAHKLNANFGARRGGADLNLHHRTRRASELERLCAGNISHHLTFGCRLEPTREARRWTERTTSPSSNGSASA
jgi:hypothetical protein